METAKQQDRDNPTSESIKDAIPLQNHWENFLDWLFHKTELFAQKYRYTLSARLIDKALDIQEQIIRARFASQKAEILQALSIEMEIMLCLLRRCYHQKLFSVSAYEYAIEQMAQAGKMTTGWRKYQKEKESNATS